MARLRTAPPSLDGYQLRLPSFEGPLDVLLRLIERDQLSISDISLLAVFGQFLSYVNSLESSNPNITAEFVTVAGRLSVLKSRALLPRPTNAVDEPDETDLVRQLEEYRAMKAAADLLAARQRMGSGAFGRGRGIAAPPSEPARVVPLPAYALTRAVGRWLTRVPLKPVPVPSFRAVSLREMIVRISSALGDNRHISFDLIRASCASRQELAVAFLAMLALVRRQTIVTIQTELFGPITLSRAPADLHPRHLVLKPDTSQSNSGELAAT